MLTHVRYVLLSLLILSMLSTATFVNPAHSFPNNQPALIVEPAAITNPALLPGDTFSINVTLYNVTASNVPTGASGVEIQLSWDNSVIQPLSYVNMIGASGGALTGPPSLCVFGFGPAFFNSSGFAVTSPPYTTATNYHVAAASTAGGWWGNGVIVTITFKVIAIGRTALALTITDLTDTNTGEVSHYIQNGVFDNTLPPPPLSVSISPMSTSITLGQYVNFNSTVTGGVSPYSYRWYQNGTIVTGANSSTWNFMPATSGSYIIYLSVNDSVLTTAVSSNASVTVTQPPSLTVSIVSSATTVYMGQIVNLGSTVGGGILPYTSQWLLNGSLITGATLANYTFSPNSTGSYVFSMNVTDSYGDTALSNIITITVAPPLTAPEIYVDPSQILNPSLGPGSTFSINITVANVTNLGACMYNLTYDPTVLTWIGFNFVQTQGQYPTAVFTGNTITGYVWICLYYATPITTLSSPLTALNFYVNSYGITFLNLTDTELLDQNGNPIVHNTFSGIFANIVIDVAVTNVVPSASWVYQNWTDMISVTVANLGYVAENFTVSAWYNSSFLIGTANVVNLAPSTNTTLSIIWNTAGVSAGNYSISGTASLVPYETYFNTTNNVFVDGIVQVLTVIRDVAITTVQPYETYFNVTYAPIISPIYSVPMVELYANRLVTINVTAANLGNVTETFNVSAYINGNISLGTTLVSNLAPQSSQVLTFQWNPSAMTPNSTVLYTVSANASLVAYEYNTTNNSMASSVKVMIKLLGDVNGDGTISLPDLVLLGHAYHTSIGQPGFNMEADFANTGSIALLDLVILASNYGKSY